MGNHSKYHSTETCMTPSFSVSGSGSPNSAFIPTNTSVASNLNLNSVRIYLNFEMEIYAYLADPFVWLTTPVSNTNGRKSNLPRPSILKF